MLRLCVLLAGLAASALGAHQLLRCECEEEELYGWGSDSEFQVNAFIWEDDFSVCSRMCEIARGETYQRRSKRQAATAPVPTPGNVAISSAGLGFNLGPGVPNIPGLTGGQIQAGPGGAGGPPVPVPGYRHAINYNCIERCSAPQFHAPNCHFECQRHGHFHDAIQVKAPPRAVATAPVLPPKPPPQPAPIPVVAPIQALPTAFRPIFAPPPLPNNGPFGGFAGAPLGGGFGGALGGPFGGAPLGGGFGGGLGGSPFGSSFGGPIAAAPRPAPHPLAQLPLSTGPGFSVATRPRPLIAPGPPVGPGPFGAPPLGGAGPLPGNVFNQFGLGPTFGVFPGAFKGSFGGQYGFGLKKKK